MACKDASSDYIAYKNIIWTFHSFHLVLHFTSFGTSLVVVGRLGAENNCVRHPDTASIHRFIFYYDCFHSMDILNINDCLGLIID